MEIFKITAVGIIGALLAVMLASYKKELSITVVLATGLVIVSMILSDIGKVFAEFEAIVSETGVKTEYFVLVMKVTGIAYVSQFASELCKDVGEGAIALKIETAAKVLVMVLTMPILKDFIANIVSILA